MKFLYGQRVKVMYEGFFHGVNGIVINANEVSPYHPNSDSDYYEYLVKMEHSEVWFDEHQLEEVRFFIQVDPGGYTGKYTPLVRREGDE